MSVVPSCTKPVRYGQIFWYCGARLSILIREGRKERRGCGEGVGEKIKEGGGRGPLGLRPPELAAMRRCRQLSGAARRIAPPMHSRGVRKHARAVAHAHMECACCHSCTQSHPLGVRLSCSPLRLVTQRETRKWRVQTHLALRLSRPRSLHGMTTSTDMPAVWALLWCLLPTRITFTVNATSLRWP